VRAIQFAVAFTGLRCPRGIATERLHDRAVSNGPYALALATQFLQLPLQYSQFLDAISDMPNMLVQEGIDFVALRLGSVAKREQFTNLVVGHIE
jgi:hypothetical protein